MSIVLGPNQYGKAENRVVRIYRDTDRHEIRDLNVSTSLRGDFSAAHLSGDQTRVLPTDTQKQTCYAYAKEKGIGSDRGLRPRPRPALRQRHRAGRGLPDRGRRVRLGPGQRQRPGTQSHLGAQQQEVRTTILTIDGKGEQGDEYLVSGLKDLILLKSTGSEFHDFLVDKYTTLIPTNDRIMATSLVARWRYIGTDVDWAASYASIRQHLLEQFAEVHSLALQQTLYEMGEAVLEDHSEVAEIKFSAPNIHHFVYDLEPFGLENPNEVFHADDRPYGLIQASVLRDDAPPAGRAWDTIPGFC